MLLQEDRLELILSSGEPNQGHKAEVRSRRLAQPRAPRRAPAPPRPPPPRRVALRRATPRRYSQRLHFLSLLTSTLLTPQVLAQYCNAFTERVLMRDMIVPPPLPNPTERIKGHPAWKQLTQGLSNSQLGRASPTHPEGASSPEATRPKSSGASRSARATPPSSAGPSRIARRGSGSSARRYVETAALAVPRLATAWGAALRGKGRLYALRRGASASETPVPACGAAVRRC